MAEPDEGPPWKQTTGMAHLHYVLKPRQVIADLGRWSLEARVDLHEWEGQFAVRSDITGETHRLSYLAGETIKSLRQGPAHLDQLASRLRLALVGPNATTAALVTTFTAGGDTQKLSAVLAELEDLRLVRRTLT